MDSLWFELMFEVFVANMEAEVIGMVRVVVVDEKMGLTMGFSTNIKDLMSVVERLEGDVTLRE